MRLRAVGCALAIVFWGGCKDPNAILISVGADAPAQQVDLYVQDESSSQIIFHSGFSPVQAPGEKPRDLTHSALKLALKLSGPGKFKLLLVGVAGDLVDGKPALTATQLFWAARVKVQGTTELHAQLYTVPPGDDADRDLWPDATDFLTHVPMAAALYQAHPELLDCDDKIDMPDPVKLLAADINPFAIETCGDGYDENCNGNADEACVDADGDHDPSTTDCDDKDPKRHHATDIDPFPDPPNCCGYSLGKNGTPDEHTSFAGDPLLCPMARCGDGIDESCSGGDTPCIVDADCDGYPVLPDGSGDCNDNDPTVHPGAAEICGNTVDENCNGQLDDGCVPCDLDGDGFERTDPKNGCPDKNDKHPGMVDCNDYDAGIYPGQMDKFGGKEAGLTSGRIASSLRGNCRRIYEPLGTTGTTKVASFDEKLGDADCNGTPFEGCPTTDCDADGDGWPAYENCDPAQPKVDCDDSDPTFFPGAPDRCGDGKAQNCSADTPCDNDADGDGYNAGVDCDDSNPNIHPWALELCNGIDDDCDQLVDEGNPDSAGAPLVADGDVTTCTDDDDGECGKKKGACVCTAAQLSATVDPAGKRTFCPTEQAGGPRPPRCVGAGQPQAQSCDAVNPKDDDCDGAVDAKDGKNLAVKGQPCGVSRGQCKSGVVVACDSSTVSCFRAPPFDALNLVPANQAWYVCSSEAACPQPEACNGLDDDCDGAPAGSATAPYPSNDERDHDGDRYLACSGCDPKKLAPGLIGCGDCDDTRPGVHPNTPDLCNGIDDDCDPNTTDGSGQCAAGTTCCQSTLSCANLATDPTNCGSCGSNCNAGHPDAANACTATGCACGSAPACGPRNYCAGGACTLCNTKSHCGDSCTACDSDEACKADGSACTGCMTSTDCADPSRPYCNNGSCKSTRPDGDKCMFDTDCTNSHCAGGTCCATTCALAVCSMPTQETDSSCATGKCVSGANINCNNYSCINGTCKISCASDSDCAANRFCNSGTCLNTRPNGTVCGGDGDCTNGHCETNGAGKICCNTPCATSCAAGTRNVRSCSMGTCMTTSNSCNGFSCSNASCGTTCGCSGGHYPCVPADCDFYFYCASQNNCAQCDRDGFCGHDCGSCGNGTYCNYQFLCPARIGHGMPCSSANCPSTNPGCRQCTGPQACPYSGTAGATMTGTCP